MGEEFYINGEPYYAIRSSSGPALEYRPAVEPPQWVIDVGRNLFESPMQRFYNGLCNEAAHLAEITEEQSKAFQQFAKAEQKRREKEKNYEEFCEITRVLENSYYR